MYSEDIQPADRFIEKCLFYEGEALLYILV